MKKKLASIVLVALLVSAGLLIVIGSAIADVDIGTFTKAISDSSSELTAELDKSEVKRGESVNVSGAASGTDIVDIVVIGPRGLRRMPDSITSEIALADGFRFMTAEVAENNTFKAEIRIPEEIYSGFHHVMVLSPGEDGVYGATNRTGGELFDAVLDYIASKGGCEDVLPGKSTEQLMDIIAAATFNTAGSDDLVVDLTFMGGATFGEVIKLNPIASVYIGEPLIVNGTAELEDGNVVILSTISGPTYLPACVVEVENGSFQCTIDTTCGIVGIYVMHAEDMKGNIDTETFELLAFVPSSAQAMKKTYMTVEYEKTALIFDMPSWVVIGETVDVRGVTSASGNLDIVIDDILMANDLPIDQNGEFEWDWNTKKTLPGMGAYTPGVSMIKAYVNCHVAGVSAGDYVRTEYKHLEPDGVCGLLFVSPCVAAEINVNNIRKGDPIIVQGIATGTDAVDFVIIGSEGLKKLPDSFFSEDAIADGLFFTSVEVDCDGAFEKSIRIPDETDSGNYRLLVLTSGRDGLYALTMREEGDLFDALMDYGWTANDFVGRNQSQLLAILEDATFNSPGSDDLAMILSFEVEYMTWYVDDDLQDYPDANFTKIQDAVNASSNGDVIIVHNGTYVENVNVNKSITIVSANGAKNTIVQAKNPDDHVFEVTADCVNISGFTVKRATGWGKAGVYLYYANDCNISNNNALNNWDGIYVGYSNNNTIMNNNVSNNHDNIYLEYSSNITVTSNALTMAGYWGAEIRLNNAGHSKISKNIIFDGTYGVFGIYMNHSSNNDISNNNISILMEWCGIYLGQSNNNMLTNNNIYSKRVIELSSSSNNIFMYNNILNGTIDAIFLSSSNNNIIYLNNFVNNTYDVSPYSYNSTNIWNSTEKITYTYKGDTYENYLGNYWDNYNGTDANSDGIGDTPHPVNSDRDNYPLMERCENYFKPQEENIFDTGVSGHPYPSIMGVHNGTIKPAHDVNVSKMFTYPCAGTGGHSEWVAFYNSTTGKEIANGTWKGYTEGNYHYIEFDSGFVLHGEVTYNYTIKTGSYPQIIHNQTFTNEYGTITCTKFTDANGKIYTDWIPAIKLE